MAGTLTTTHEAVAGRPGVHKVTYTWVSDASGDVNANTDDIPAGSIIGVRHNPDSGGTQPTNLYDVTLPDADGVDLLRGTGANIVNTGPSDFIPLLGDGTTVDHIPFQGGGTVTPTVANAGNAKGGAVVLYIWDGVTS